MSQAKPTPFPFPPPELLKAYNEAEAGLAGRMFSEIEAEAKHRREMEAKVLTIQDADIKAQRVAERLGQIFGLIIALFTVAAATYAAVHGAQVAGSIIGTGGLIGLVAVFIYGRRVSPVPVIRYDRPGPTAVPVTAPAETEVVPPDGESGKQRPRGREKGK